MEKSVGCVRDSEEIRCYLCAASSLLKRVEEPLLTLGKQRFADVKEEVLLKSVCVYIYTYTLYLDLCIYLYGCMGEFRSCCLNALLKKL